MLATQIIARIQAMVAVELPVRNLFETPTVAELAEQIEQALRQEQRMETPPLVPISREQPLPLSFAQQRLWFLDQLEPNNTAYNIPLVLRLQGALKVDVLAQSLRELVNRHEILRTAFPTVNNQPIQISEPPDTFCLERVDLSMLAVEEREAAIQRYAHLHAMHVFHLEEGPLLKALLLTIRSQQEHVLLLTMHHIIADGWSLGILTRELTVLYNAFANGTSSPLPALPIQYADFAFWQRQWLQGSILDAQVAYWQQQLHEVVPLELPTDYPRPAIQTFQGAQEKLLISASLRDELKQLCIREEVTLFMVLAAAFQV